MAVHKLIREHAGLEVFVKPLVVFVGDWSVKDKWRDTDVRVITADGVARYFDRQDQPELTRREKIDLFAFESDGARCVRGSTARSSRTSTSTSTSTRTRKGLTFAEATPKAFASGRRGKGT